MKILKIFQEIIKFKRAAIKIKKKLKVEYAA